MTSRAVVRLARCAPAAPVRTGVLGCASIACRRLLPAMCASPEVDLVVVAGRDPARAERVAGRFGAEPAPAYEQVLERADIEAVYIPLPNSLHHHWASAALQAGKHVLVEKPMAMTVEEVADLVSLAADRDLVLRENVMFPHHPRHRRVRELLDGGTIGRLRGVHAVFGIPMPPPGDIRHRPELGGGALLDVGVYPVRAAQLFVDGALQVAGACVEEDVDTGVDVSGSALLHTADGVLATLAFGYGVSYRGAYELWGEEGRITVERAFAPVRGVSAVRVERDGRTEEVVVPPWDQVRGAVETFARSVREPDPAPAEGAVSRARLLSEVRATAHRSTCAVPPPT
ncbi:Gfo/Idh/MocA family protein [Streptomyces sp. NPDC001658]